MQLYIEDDRAAIIVATTPEHLAFSPGLRGEVTLLKFERLDRPSESEDIHALAHCIGIERIAAAGTWLLLGLDVDNPTQQHAAFARAAARIASSTGAALFSIDREDVRTAVQHFGFASPFSPRRVFAAVEGFRRARWLEGGGWGRQLLAADADLARQPVAGVEYALELAGAGGSEPRNLKLSRAAI